REYIDVIVRSTRPARVDVSGHAVMKLVTRARGHLFAPHMLAHVDAHEVRNRVLHRHFDEVAAPGAMALLERSEYANRAMHAGAAVANRSPGERRRRVGIPARAHGPTHCLRHRLEALIAAVGAVGAEAFDACVDEPRV